MFGLHPFIELVSALVERDMDPDEYSLRFFELHWADRPDWPRDVADVLQRLISDADAFEPDPAIRDESMIDADELRQYATEALRKLREFDERDKRQA